MEDLRPPVLRSNDFNTGGPRSLFSRSLLSAAEPKFGRAPVRVETLHGGKCGNHGSGAAQARSVVADEARAAEKVGDAQPAEVPTGAPRGKDVARAGRKISEHGGGFLPDPDAPA